MRARGSIQVAKELMKFNKEVLIKIILKHSWRNPEYILHDARFYEWEAASHKNLEMLDRHRKQETALAEKIKKMPRNTDEEKLEVLRAECRLIDMFKKHDVEYKKSTKKVDALYEAIGE